MPLGKRVDFGDAKYAGLEVPYSCSLVEALKDAQVCGLDFLLVPLADPSHRRRSPKSLPPSDELLPPFTRSDLLLTSAEWSSQILGKLSQWIDPDSDCPDMRRDSEAAMEQELSWAAHLGLQAVVLPLPPHPEKATNYARIACQALSTLSHMGLWIRLPMVSPKAELVELQEVAGVQAENGADDSADAAKEDTWEWWHRIRCLCESHNLLGVILDIPESLPPADSWRRWLGEPLKAAVLPTSAFVTNKRGYPTLSKSHQNVLSCFFKHNIQVILTGQSYHGPAAQNAPTATAAAGDVLLDADPGANHPLRVYWEYLSFIFRRMDGLNEQEAAELRYRDYLQAPLQPLQDNLESSTYETFERDTIKYTTYQEAVYRALLDRTPPLGKEAETVVLMVVGAGRGPLVRASLLAAKRAKRKLRVYAVEKNPNAVVTLQHLVVQERWQDLVTIVHVDMRQWCAPEKADILVSELLGSFGDNELSPECLDGAQRFLKDDGISIPESYTSYLVPITCNKLYSDVKAYKDLEHFETPYVVKFHNMYPLAETREVFTFSHPNRSDVIDNTRYRCLKFERSEDRPAAALHGFAGYFDTKLYGDVCLSTHPPTHTPDMFSWFPIYFPIRHPIHVPAGEDVEVHMWRCAAAHKVWYEWAVTEPEVSPVHNVNGRSYYVGL